MILAFYVSIHRLTLRLSLQSLKKLFVISYFDEYTQQSMNLYFECLEHKSAAMNNHETWLKGSRE